MAGTINKYSFNTAGNFQVNAAEPTRYLGGSEQKIHPFIKGYFYVFFQFPGIITSENQKEFEVGNGLKLNNTIGNKILLSLCEGFQPPGDRTLKTEVVNGMGGLDASFVTGQTLNRNFSLNFRELWGNPVFAYHRMWTSIIDPFYGGTNKDIAFIPSNYKGKILVIQTTPNIIAKTRTQDGVITEASKYITKVNLFTGVVPTTDLSSAYDANISDNSIVKPTVNYEFDGKDYDETFPGVLNNAAKILQTVVGKDSIRNVDHDSATFKAQ
jgi:hypothetical protein